MRFLTLCLVALTACATPTRPPSSLPGEVTSVVVPSLRLLAAIGRGQQEAVPGAGCHAFGVLVGAVDATAKALPKASPDGFTIPAFRADLRMCDPAEVLALSVTEREAILAALAATPPILSGVLDATGALEADCVGSVIAIDVTTWATTTAAALLDDLATGSGVYEFPERRVDVSPCSVERP